MKQYITLGDDGVPHVNEHYKEVKWETVRNQGIDFEKAFVPPPLEQRGDELVRTLPVTKDDLADFQRCPSCGSLPAKPIQVYGVLNLVQSSNLTRGRTNIPRKLAKHVLAKARRTPASSIGKVLYFDERNGRAYLEVAVPAPKSITGFLKVRKDLETEVRLNNCSSCGKNEWRILRNKSVVRRDGESSVECFMITIECKHCGEARFDAGMSLTSLWERLRRSLNDTFQRTKKVSVNGSPRDPAFSVELEPQEKVPLSRC